MAAPTVTDIINCMQSAQFWPTSTAAQTLATTQATIALASAIESFEMMSGWHPFVKDSAATTRYYDTMNQNGYVQLDGGLMEFTSVVVRGNPYTLGSGVWLEPANNPAMGLPYMRLKFWPRLYFLYVWPWPQSVAVTGKWGRVADWPDDAFQVVVRKAAVDTLSATNQTQNLASWSEDGFEESYDITGVITPQDLLTEWPKDFERVAGRYRNVSVGFASGAGA